MGTNITGIGNANAIGFKSRVTGGMYFPPELKDALVGVWSAYGKSNNSTDRNIIKNKIKDKGGDFVISNADFKLNSGFGKYEVDFTTFNSNSSYVSNLKQDSFDVNKNDTSVFILYKNINSSSLDTPPFKIKVSNLVNSIIYAYINDNGTRTSFSIKENGEYVLPKSYNSLTNNETWIGFRQDSNVNCQCTIKQIPSFEGAFVTDGIDDLITSTKTVQEMLGGSKEITVVSMMANLDSRQILCNSNYSNTNGYNVRNTLEPNGVISMLGYTDKNGTTNNLNLILGDKDSIKLVDKVNFNSDYVFYPAQYYKSYYQVAWYWTFIANRVLTTDEINQVIAYYNLDRTLKPDILCNVKKQRITNENHAEFNDKLIDYSGNGRDIQLNNIAWNKESGIDDNGALCLDGIDDFGKVTGMPVYKDYTVVTDREIFANIGAISSKNNPGAFMETAGNAVYSFGQATSGLNFISTRSISYLSKYSYCGQSITAGAAEDGTDMWLGTVRDNDSRFFNGAIYSLMSFPYSMSEFLIERQLKKHKLGTLYPNMVEFRPVITANANYKIVSTALLPLTGDTWEEIKVGDYVAVGRRVAIQVSFDNDASELVSAISSKLDNVSIAKNSNGEGYFIFGDILKSKSPQKINITIDEYIRYEDIVQPYPVLLRFKDENGNEVSWGGKFRVGSTITRIGSAADSNLLPNIYNIFGLLLNDNQVTSSKVIVEKTIVFKAKSAYIFDDNEPKVILSPSRLRIPNSSYKILGHIPDISGHGNHGVIHNSAYAEGSGVNEDGSYQFDGVDDFITIPTTVGGKQVLMKVNWQSYAGGVTLYDQRFNLSDYEFAIYNGNRDLDDNPIPAYQGRNNGQTYIDGILNSNIKASELRYITHNITITNELSLGTNNTYPVIGSTRWNTHFAQMSLYDFMLFDEISTDDKIKELNEYVGIEGDFYEMDFNNDFLIGN